MGFIDDDKIEHWIGLIHSQLFWCTFKHLVEFLAFDLPFIFHVFVGNITDAFQTWNQRKCSTRRPVDCILHMLGKLININEFRRYVKEVGQICTPFLSKNGRGDHQQSFCIMPDHEFIPDVTGLYRLSKTDLVSNEQMTVGRFDELQDWPELVGQENGRCIVHRVHQVGQCTWEPVSIENSSQIGHTSEFPLIQ